MKNSQFTNLIEQGYNHIPFSREVVVDTDTALALYLKLANNPYSYFLESVQGGEKWGRYSFIGLSAETVIKVYDYQIFIEKNGELLEQYDVEDPLAWIEDYQKKFKVPKLESLPDFNGGLVGYFGYEIIRYIEPKLSDINKTDELNVPDILLMVSNDLLVVDNLSSKVHIITHINPSVESYEDAISKLSLIEENIKKSFNHLPAPSENIKAEDFVSSFGRKDFLKAVDNVQKYIIAGDVMQVVPSQRLSCSFKAKPIELYRQLRILNPSPYMYFLNLDEFSIVGSSPEILTRVDNDNIATDFTGPALTITPLPDFYGEVELTIFVNEILTDELYSDNKSFILTVSNVNDPPELQPVDEISFDEDGSISTNLVGNDIDSDILIYNISDGINIIPDLSANTGLLSFTAADNFSIAQSALSVANAEIVVGKAAAQAQIDVAIDFSLADAKVAASMAETAVADAIKATAAAKIASEELTFDKHS